jgi:hypothetical protein
MLSVRNKKKFKLGQNLNLLVLAFGPIGMLIMYFLENSKFYFVSERLEKKISSFFLKHSATVKNSLYFLEVFISTNYCIFCRGF